MGILILGLLLVRVLPLTLRKFMPLYLLLVISNIVVHYFFIENISILWQIGAAIAGIGVVFVLAGLLGELKTSSHYEAILVGVSIYPWYLGWIESVIYIAASIIMVAIIYFGKQRRATKKFMISKDKFDDAENILNKKAYPEFKKMINAIYTTPIGVAAVFSVIFYSLAI